MHPVAIANTRTTITAAIDPPSPGLSAVVLWLCCAVVVSVMLTVVPVFDVIGQYLL